MSIEIIILALFGGMILLLMLGVPVTFAIGGLSIVLTFAIFGTKGLYTVATTAYGEITASTLITITMFTLIATFLVNSGISDRLFRALSYWLSGVRGNLALVALGVCTALAMVAGFGPGIITMGMIALPAMLKRNYDKSLATGVVMAGGVLGDLIPPSMIMIIFGFITHLSIGKLFAAGMIPGFILASFYAVYILLRCHFDPKLAPKEVEDVTWKMRLVSLREVIAPILLIVAVLGSIFAGIATPTEAGAVGALGAFLCSVIYRSVSWKMIMDSCLETLKITGMVLWILIAATLFGVFFTSVGAQPFLLKLVQTLQINRWFIIIGMQVILLILGCFMDDFAICIITAPIFTPIAVSLGFNPIWFAILFVCNMQIAYLSPPFGWSLIMLKGIAPPEVSTRDLWKAVPPFIGLQLIVLILVMLFPQLSLWLPGKLIG